MKKASGLIAIIFGLAIALMANVVPALADETTDEDQLFSGGDTVVSQDQITNDKVDEELKEKHLGFSGQINANLGYTKLESGQDLLSNQVSTDLFLDIRLKKGIKGFLSAGIDYYPALSDQMIAQLDLPPETQDFTRIRINEFFIDANANNKVYFRIGKQYLKWGQGYFWNPADFINTTKKDFFNMDAIASGVFGTKIQLPFGVKQNIYSFIGMNDAKTFNDLSLSGKYEFLIKNTEMSLSASIKNDRQPFYGFDITGRVFGLDYRGEIGLKNGLNYTRLDYNSLSAQSGGDGLIPQVSLGFSKFFTVKDIKDQIGLNVEFFYNQAGYDQNIIQRIADESDLTVRETAQTIYSTNYQLFMNSKYYFALFGSVQKFIVPEMTLNINSMMNLVDKSAVLTTGISYIPALTDMSVNFNINTFLGAPNTEATSLGGRWSMSLGTKLAF